MKKFFFKKTGIIILSSIIGLNFSLFNISDSNRNYIYVNATTSADFNISDNGMAFICSLEGYAQTCFWDNSQWSIGYGNKCTSSGHNSNPSRHEKGPHTISQQQATELFKERISEYVDYVKKYVPNLEMNQNQFDALVSLCYNAGPGRLSNSPLVNYLKGNLTEQEARTKMSSYIIYDGGSVSQGLINRRNAEADLFFSGTLSNECTCSESYAGEYVVTTQSTNLVMRAGHGSSYSMITTIPKGAIVYVSKADGTWAHVEYNGNSGYCSMQYLTKNGLSTCNCSESYSGNYVVTTESTDLNMRSDHSSSSSIVTKIPKGETVYVSKADGTWAHVEYNGNLGYCSMQYLTKTEPVVTEPPVTEPNPPITEPEIPIEDDVYLNAQEISILDNGETYQLELINASNINDIVWLSSDNSIATVDSKGLVTALNSGNAIIYAAYNEKAFACNVTVIKDTTPKLSSTNLKITSLNDRYKLEVLNIDDVVTWLSEDTSIVTVTNGLVLPVSNGSTTIYAIVDNQTFECSVVVDMEADMLGDCNNDGQVNISDLLLMKKYIFGLTSSNSINLANANLNEDYNIDVIDLIMLKNKLFN